MFEKVKRPVRGYLRNQQWNWVLDLNLDMLGSSLLVTLLDHFHG